jgi:hypothetical protein
MKLLAIMIFILTTILSFGQEPPTNTKTENLRLRISCPIYIMEYHLWYESPSVSSPMTKLRKWPATSTHNEYPLLGYYSSGNREIIRWQVSCLKASGVDGVFVQLFPDREGLKFEKIELFELVLEEADKVGLKVACHDEVQFRKGWKAQQPDIMAARASAFIKKYAAHSAYLHIDGRPAYAFQFWNHFQKTWSHLEMDTLLSKVSEEGKVNPFWIIYGGREQALYGDSRIPAHVVTANSNFIRPWTDHASEMPIDWTGLWLRLKQFDLSRSTYPGKQLGLWAYPRFYDSQGKGFPHQNKEGNILLQVLKAYDSHHPDFIMLSSWNDWLENSAMEPGYYDNTLSNDPYLYCRLLAELKNLKFTPPPLPDPRALDPLFFEHLKGRKP